MEAIFAASSADGSISSYRQIKNPAKKKNRDSRSTENLVPTNSRIHGGLLFAPPASISFSYPPSHSFFHQNQRQQPPFHPLPTSNPHNSLPSRSRERGFSCPPANSHNSLPSRSRERGFSCPPATRKTNRSTRDLSLTSKKSKQSTQIDEPNPDRSAGSPSLIIESTSPLGPDPNDLPTDVSKVLASSFTAINDINSVAMKDLERFSGSVFTVSPPPSKLPLPKFSIRPKLSCTAEATGIDAGATANLRRLLRLR